MKTINLLTLLIIGSFSTLQSQNFSFFDNFEVYVRPLDYVVNKWNTHYTLQNSLDVNLYNPLNDNSIFDPLKLEPIRLKNYLSQEYGLKYFLKAHKNFKIGLGINYKKRKLEYDLFIPNQDVIIWALRYKAKYDYFGFNLTFRLDIPKIKSNINFYWELNSPLNKDKRRPELTVFYPISYILFIQTQHSIPKSIVDAPYIGFEFGTEVYKNFYLNFHLSYKYDSDYFSRIYYYEQDENTNLIPIFKGIAGSNDFVIGLGLVYQFSNSMQDN